MTKRRRASDPCRCKSQGHANLDNAKEIVNDAISQFFDPDYKPWDPEEPTELGLLRDLGSRVCGIVSNFAKKQARRPRHQPIDLDQTDPPDPCDITGVAHAEQLAYAALELVDGDEDACAILFLMIDGCTKASDQAAALGWPVKKVYKQRERLRKKLQPLRNDEA